MHNIIISGQHLELTPSITQYVTTKLGHVLRHAPEALNIDVHITKEGHSPVRYLVKGHIVIWGPDMHITTTDTDLYAAIDAMSDRLSRMARQRHGIKKHNRHTDDLKKEEAKDSGN